MIRVTSKVGILKKWSDVVDTLDIRTSDGAEGVYIDNDPTWD